MGWDRGGDCRRRPHGERRLLSHTELDDGARGRQTGVQVATHKIDRTIRLSDDGQTFTAMAHAVTYDMSGNVIADLRVPSTGERMPVDRIPDQP